jgi:hypothetical protein
MGKGNVCVRGKYETLYYVDYENFWSYVVNEEGEDTSERDYDGEVMFIQDSINEFVGRLVKMSPSFYTADRWIGRDIHIVAENALFMIGIEDNEWSYAVKLLQKEDVSLAFQKRHFKRLEVLIRDLLFEQFLELGVYGGAWTSGTIKRPVPNMLYVSDVRIKKEERKPNFFYYAVRHSDFDLGSSRTMRGYTIERFVFVNHYADVVTNFEIPELMLTEGEDKPYMSYPLFLKKYDPLQVDELIELKEKENDTKD